MNKTYKVVWSTLRSQFVVTDESHSAHTKTKKIMKAASALFFSLAILPSQSHASSSYTEPGIKGNISSWETPEYKKDWGLGAMHASTAYSLGFNGSGTQIAVMDSGALLSHPELNSERITASEVSGSYGSSGNRYPYGGKDYDGKYDKGQQYHLTGNWIDGVNDTHGTHVLGTVGANRDGKEFHGVAWGANVIIGNTGAIDDNSYGPHQDYDFFLNGWSALANKMIESNGKKRGGVINNSWGTNPRILRGVKAGEAWPTKPNFANFSTENFKNVEYEYFYHLKKSGQGKTNADAAYDSVKGTNVVQVLAAGNRGHKNPNFQKSYPLFNPDAEKHWLVVGSVGDDPDWENMNMETYEIPSLGCAATDRFNHAGLAKYWFISAPGEEIYGSIVELGDDENYGIKKGDPGYSSKDGTSMSSPHVTGAIGVLMSRYPDMSAIQVKDVMLTTANHKQNDGISNMKGWDNFDGTTPADGEVSDRMGWGVPDLAKGMYGPAQFLGRFEYSMDSTPLDVWSNDITQTALEQRKKEEDAWMEKTKNGTDPSAFGDYELGNSFVMVDGDQDTSNHVVTEEEAKRARQAYFTKLTDSINQKRANHLYEGSLIKKGKGTLVMTGQNSYTGGTVVNDGSLLGFSESFGSGDVNVNGGTFGLLSSYNDNFTQKGQLNSLVGVARAPIQKANVVVNNGGTYAIVADQNVQAGNLTFKPGSKVTVISLTDNAFEKAYDGIDQVGTVTADKIEGFNENAVVTPDFALVDHTVTLNGNTLTGVLTKNNKTLADYAANSNGVAVANAIMGDDALLAGLTDATKDEARNTLNSLGNDIHVTANAMTVANGQSLVRAIKDQANGIDGAARVADVDGGRARLWLSAVGYWSKMDRTGASKLKADFYTGLVGLEADINANNKVGVFFGAGKTKFKGGHDGKIDSDDLHFGIYGQSKFEPVRLNYGFAYTHQGRDANSALFYKDQAFAASPSYNAKFAQIFGEVAYTGLNFGSVNVEPYVGLAWMHLSADDFSNDYVGGKVSTKFDSQNLAVSNLGARAKVPFGMGPAKFKAVADVNWTQYMGDTRGKSTLKFGNGASAKIKSEKLSAVAAVGVGLEAQLGKGASLGVSYYGAYGSKIKSNGVGATFKLAF